MTHKQLDYFLIFLIIVLSAACLYFINVGDNSTVAYQAEYVAKSDDITVINLQPTYSVGDIVFDSGDVKNGVVGYFAGGAFVTTLPDWMVNNWISKTDDVPGTTVFSPRTTDETRDFSDIVVYTTATSETANAEYFFERDKIAANVAEVLLGRNGDFRIYHIETEVAGRVFSRYYIDGNGMTGIFTFDASSKNYYKYSVKIKEFINGLGVNEKVRG